MGGVGVVVAEGVRVRREEVVPEAVGEVPEPGVQMAMVPEAAVSMAEAAVMAVAEAMVAVKPRGERRPRDPRGGPARRHDVQSRGKDDPREGKGRWSRSQRAPPVPYFTRGAPALHLERAAWAGRPRTRDLLAARPSGGRGASLDTAAGHEQPAPGLP